MATAELTVKMTELESVKAMIADLTGERDRARDIAVQLEQELADLRCRVEQFAVDLKCGPHCTMGEYCQNSIISGQLLGLLWLGAE